MIVCSNRRDFLDWRNALDARCVLGCVPTMGALHDGHVSLIKRSREECDRTVVSIFVNRLQFNSAADFQSYPRGLEADLESCEAQGVDVVFAPAQEDFYRPDHSTFCEVRGLDQHLCGAHRPGHFRGVCTVVLKLLHVLTPHAAYFGAKDFQQARILEKMIEDLNLPIDARICPIIREPTGLARSSRNELLSTRHRLEAAAIYRGLRAAAGLFVAGERRSGVLEERVRKELDQTPDARPEYVTIVDQKTLQPISVLNEPAVLAAACWYGGVRLIDCVLLPE